MEGKLSPFKQRLREPAPLHGFFMGQPNPAVVEMIGWAGFDFVIVDREHGPAGLDIGAETPEQIALSIVAEIEAANSGRAGGMLKHRVSALH